MMLDFSFFLNCFSDLASPLCSYKTQSHKKKACKVNKAHLGAPVYHTVLSNKIVNCVAAICA